MATKAKATKVVEAKQKKTPGAKQQPMSKAGIVRAYITAHPKERDSEVAKATGIPAGYVWDVRAVMLRAAGLKAPAKKVGPREPKPEPKRTKATAKTTAKTSKAKAAVPAVATTKVPPVKVTKVAAVKAPKGQVHVAV